MCSIILYLSEYADFSIPTLYDTQHMSSSQLSELSGQIAYSSCFIPSIHHIYTSRKSAQAPDFTCSTKYTIPSSRARAYPLQRTDQLINATSTTTTSTPKPKPQLRRRNPPQAIARLRVPAETNTMPPTLYPRASLKKIVKAHANRPLSKNVDILVRRPFTVPHTSCPVAYPLRVTVYTLCANWLECMLM